MVSTLLKGGERSGSDGSQINGRQHFVAVSHLLFHHHSERRLTKAVGPSFALLLVPMKDFRVNDKNTAFDCRLSLTQVVMCCPPADPGETYLVPLHYDCVPLSPLQSFP